MKKRILSAIVALIIVVPLVIYGHEPFILGVGALSILGLKEIIDLKKHHNKIPNFMMFVAYICVFLLVISEYDGYSIAFGLTYRGLAITMLSLFIPTVLYKKDKYTAKDALYLAGAVVFLGLVFNGLILIRMFSLWKFLYLVIIPIVTDIFAMLMGMLVGRHKLIPQVSPNKTVEGSIIGSMVGTLVPCFVYLFFVNPDINIAFLIFMTFVISIFGQLGDLLFSSIKRYYKIKDFSRFSTKEYITKRFF